jgi:hypothetical protein
VVNRDLVEIQVPHAMPFSASTVVAGGVAGGVTPSSPASDATNGITQGRGEFLRERPS